NVFCCGFVRRSRSARLDVPAQFLIGPGADGVFQPPAEANELPKEKLSVTGVMFFLLHPLSEVLLGFFFRHAAAFDGFLKFLEPSHVPFTLQALPLAVLILVVSGGQCEGPALDLRSEVG